VGRTVVRNKKKFGGDYEEQLFAKYK